MSCLEMEEDTRVKNDFEKTEPIPPNLHVQLSVISGPDMGTAQKLWKSHSVLGRGKCDIRFSDNSASKEHCSIDFEEGRFVLRDMGSTNGTMLNGGQVWEADLGNLDEITIGDTVIQFSILEEEAISAEELDIVVVEADPASQTTRPQKARIAKDPNQGPLFPGVDASLKVVMGEDAGKEMKLFNKVTSIGRSGSDLVISDPESSRKHATIEFLAKDKVIVKDLNSVNGTYLNRKPVSVATIKNGDALQIGSTVINFFVRFGA